MKIRFATIAHAEPKYEIRKQDKMIKEFFGVCLVSIIGEHQRDYRESERL